MTGGRRLKWRTESQIEWPDNWTDPDGQTDTVSGNDPMTQTKANYWRPMTSDWWRSQTVDPGGRRARRRNETRRTVLILLKKTQAVEDPDSRPGPSWRWWWWQTNWWLTNSGRRQTTQTTRRAVKTSWVKNYYWTVAQTQARPAGRTQWPARRRQTENDNRTNDRTKIGGQWQLLMMTQTTQTNWTVTDEGQWMTDEPSIIGQLLIINGKIVWKIETEVVNESRKWRKDNDSGSAWKVGQPIMTSETGQTDQWQAIEPDPIVLTQTDSEWRTGDWPSYCWLLLTHCNWLMTIEYWPS